jgi:hypothetical protein
MTAEAVHLRWRAHSGGYAARSHVHTYAVTKQGCYWAAWMKYRIIHGDKNWDLVAGQFSIKRRQAMANAEAHETEICAASASTLETRRHARRRTCRSTPAPGTQR